MSLSACAADRVDAASSLSVHQAKIFTDTGSRELWVELARSKEERARGLMGRTSLNADGGMLFVYPELQPRNLGFWMFRTEMPLDIAFLDPQGKIVAMHTMKPCRSSHPERCRVYSPQLPFQFALEVNAGYFERHDVKVGDRLTLPLGEMKGKE